MLLVCPAGFLWVSLLGQSVDGAADAAADDVVGGQSGRVRPDPKQTQIEAADGKATTTTTMTVTTTDLVMASSYIIRGSSGGNLKAAAGRSCAVFASDACGRAQRRRRR